MKQLRKLTTLALAFGLLVALPGTAEAAACTGSVPISCEQQTENVKQYDGTQGLWDYDVTDSGGDWGDEVSYSIPDRTYNSTTSISFACDVKVYLQLGLHDYDEGIWIWPGVQNRTNPQFKVQLNSYLLAEERTGTKADKDDGTSLIWTAASPNEADGMTWKNFAGVVLNGGYIWDITARSNVNDVEMDIGDVPYADRFTFLDNAGQIKWRLRILDRPGDGCGAS